MDLDHGLDEMTDAELARIAVFEPQSFIHLEAAEQPAVDWTVYADPNPFPRIRLFGRCRSRG